MLWMVAILAALSAQGARAQTTPEPARAEPTAGTADPESGVSADAERAAEIEGLIRLLASPQYSKRAAATARLTEIGTAAYANLHIVFHETDDLEVKLLIEQIVRESWLDHYVFGRIGFLGISRKREPAPTHEGNPRIPEGQTGIAIGSVIEGTGAAKAGLKVDDIIIALDGVPLKGDALMAFTSFAKSIRERGTGANVSLTVLRGAEVKQFDATLGPVPRTALRSVEGLLQLYRVGVRRLEEWWFEDFHRPPDAVRGTITIPEFQPISGNE